MINVAVIGTGNMGKHHARIYSELPNARLVAIADIEDSSELAERFGCKYYNDYNEMMDKEDVHAVSVCVPTSLHHGVGKEIISRGKHVLIEKPITDKVENAEELIELAKSKNVRLAVGHVERFNPAVRKMKEIIDNGSLGEITSVLSQRVGLFPPQIKDASVITDLGVHDIDIFNYLLGKDPKQVIISSGKALNNKRDDYADIFIIYEGTNGFIEVNWITPVKIRVLNVTGKKGFAQLDYITQKLLLYKSNYEKTHDQFGDFVVKFGTPEKEEIVMEKSEPLKEELKDFIECIENKREPFVTGKDGLKALKIALGMV